MRKIASAKIWLLTGSLVFLSGILSLLVSGQREMSASNIAESSEDGLGQVGVDLAQGSRARLLNARIQAQTSGEATYTIELETNATP